MNNNTITVPVTAPISVRYLTTDLFKFPREGRALAVSITHAEDGSFSYVYHVASSDGTVTVSEDEIVSMTHLDTAPNTRERGWESVPLSRESERELEAERGVAAVCAEVWRFVTTEGPKTNAEIRRHLGGGDRKRRMVPRAISWLMDRGMLVRAEDGRYWGVYTSQDAEPVLLPADRAVEFVPATNPPRSLITPEEGLSNSPRYQRH